MSNMPLQIPVNVCNTRILQLELQFEILRWVTLELLYVYCTILNFSYVSLNIFAHTLYWY
jgi:hypothetical protein